MSILSDEPYLTITPLGGFGEIGLNCQLWETAKGVVMIDCGLMFPTDDHLGVDILIPNIPSIVDIRDRLLGIILTHGHEDHIGALPWILPRILPQKQRPIRIFGSRFTMGLLESRLYEHNLQSAVDIAPVDNRSNVRLGDLRFQFFNMCHSIPEGFALGIETPIGRVIHTGDFKIDNNATANSQSDLNAIQRFCGMNGARLLLSDSTNAESPGRSLSEIEVEKALDNVFATATGRIIITLFSSHIQRIEEVFNLANKYDRTVVISGKSLASNIEIARATGTADLPTNFFNAWNGVPDMPANKLVLLVTGTQGEPMSALSRMINGEHKQLSIIPGDTVIMSSRIIPGNDRAVSKLINEMYRQGAEVLYENVRPIHASGHAYQDELAEMLEATRPELFIPMHGEYRHLVKHGLLAQRHGVNKDNVIILENGMPITIFNNSFRLGSCIQTEYTFVDGKGVGDVGRTVLRERRILGDEGMVIVFVVLDVETGAILHGPQMISRGFIFEQQYNHILEDAKCLVLDAVEAYNLGQIRHLEEDIRGNLRRFFRYVLDRDPIVVPVVSEV